MHPKQNEVGAADAGAIEHAAGTLIRQYPAFTISYRPVIFVESARQKG